MRFTLDTNILVYAYDRDAGDRHSVAAALLHDSRSLNCVLTLQSLSEFFRALTGPKYRVAPHHVAERVQFFLDALPVVAANDVSLQEAMDAVTHHGWSFWDAMIWATAKQHGCRFLITEDGQSGRTLGGVTLVNPFLPDADGLLAAALGRR